VVVSAGEVLGKVSILAYLGRVCRVLKRDASSKFGGSGSDKWVIDNSCVPGKYMSWDISRQFACDVG
jgi:hypothetical protein